MRLVQLPVFFDDALLDSAQTKRRLERNVPDAEVVYLPETGHFIPGQTARIISFLSREERPDGR